MNRSRLLTLISAAALVGAALVLLQKTPMPAGAAPDDEKAADKAKDADDSKTSTPEKKTYPPLDPAMGAVEGRIVLEGPPPEIPAPAIKPGQQQYDFCSKHVKSEALILGKDNAVKNAVAAISGYRPAKRPAPRNLTLDNKHCLFVPHVAATTVGSVLTLKNSDAFMHNSRGALSLQFNNAIGPKSESPTKVKLRKTGKKVSDCWGVVSCDFHTWMQAFIYVFPHDLFDVTGVDGKYRIVNIPPGTYEIEFAHEVLANPFLSIKKKVTVEAGKTVKLDVEMTAPK